MAIPSGDIAGAVFRSAVKREIGKLSLDGEMLKVLLVLDGKKDLASVARTLGMKLWTARDLINKLLDLQIVERIKTADSLLDENFLDFLKAQLSLAIGPIAEVMIEDIIYELGIDPIKIPKYRAAEIVDFLSRQIPREGARIIFQQAMVNKMKEKGY